MELQLKLLIFISSILTSFTNSVQSADSCNPTSCVPGQRPLVSHPFRLKLRQPENCSLPGFDLHCNSRNQTILRLPNSGDFAVQFIDYNRGKVFLDDPDDCLANRTANFSVAGTPFVADRTEFDLYNCSSLSAYFSPFESFVRLPCGGVDGETNGTVVVAAVRSASEAAPPPDDCRKFGNASIPLWTDTRLWLGSVVAFQLSWSMPATDDDHDRTVCGYGYGYGFGYRPVPGQPNRCPRPPSGPGLPKSAKYALGIGVGIPALICFAGLACYGCGLVRASRRQQRLGSQLPIVTRSYESSPIAGLDQPTIAAYPMTVLGESRRLPKPTHTTCPICLSDYEPKDVLRSIPECSHYFHANCVDEWLKLNGSCPVCRSLPETSSSDSPCSSIPSSSSSPLPPIDRCLQETSSSDSPCSSTPSSSSPSPPIDSDSPPPPPPPPLGR
ncbi:putative RING-H2 finger protein ATL21A isoform X2 [Andrographis paniculata]|nr:putative RING-H2 finger protein ATL21A isoform X2 [Andrographis paniculata]